MQASVVVAPGLQSTGSIVMACRLSCPEACGTLLDQGMNPCPSCAGRFFTTEPPEKTLEQFFLLEYKMGPKAAEAACNINSAFGPERVRNVQWWFKKFCKGDESCDDAHSGQGLEVDNDQLRAIIKADLLTTT